MRKWLSILVALLVVAALVAAGCGGSDDNGDGGGDDGDMSAAGIVKKSNEAMAKMQSAAFAMDMSLTMEGDASKLDDPQAAQLLSSPITVTASGKVANDPQKLDMSMKADAMGQAFDLGLKMDGDIIYLQFMGSWYEIPKDMAEGMTGASPAPEADQEKLTEIYKQLGIDPDTWAADYVLEGEEDVDGVTCYKISQQVDIDKVAADLSKVANSASGLGAITGGSDITSDPEELQKGIDTLKNAVKDVKVEMWIGKDDYYLYKMSGGATIDVTALPEEDRQDAGGARVDVLLHGARHERLRQGLLGRAAVRRQAVRRAVQRSDAVGRPEPLTAVASR